MVASASTSSCSCNDKINVVYDGFIQQQIQQRDAEQAERVAPLPRSCRTPHVGFILFYFFSFFPAGMFSLPNLHRRPSNTRRHRCALQHLSHPPSAHVAVVEPQVALLLALELQLGFALTGTCVVTCMHFHMCV